MEPDIWTFVTGFRDHTDNYNFTSQLSPYVGKFRIERKDLEPFWKIYCDALERNPGMLSGLSERPNEYMPLLNDTDLQTGKSPEIDLSQRLYTREQVKVVIKVYQKVIKEVSKEWRPRNNVVLLLEKPACYVSGELVKGGFHLHFPRLWIRNCDHDLHIYPRVVKYLNEEHKQLFGNLGVASAGEVIDKGVSKKHWLMYGGAKSEVSGAYKVTAAFDVNTNEIPLSEAFAGYKLYDCHEEEIKLNEGNYGYYLPRILSIHPAGKTVSMMKTNLQCISRQAIATARERTVQHENTNVAENMSLATELMPMIGDWRADERDDWHEMGRILYCIGDGCQEALDLWIEFSARTSKDNYDEAYCIAQWQKMINGHWYSIGTLRYYASLDNPEKYEEWKKKRSSGRAKEALEGGHNDLAKMLHDLYANVFVCGDLEARSWFEYKNHKWNRVQKGTTLRAKISDELVARFAEERRKLYQEMGENEDGEEDKGVADSLKAVKKIIKNLKQAPFKDSVMRECMEVFYNEEFFKRLDTDINLMGFTNGVLDLRNMVFRGGKPDDYVSMSTGYEYREFSEADPEVTEVKDFLLKVFPDPLLKQFFLEYCARLLKGGNFNKTFLVMTGVGDNAKSVTIELIMMALGEYAIKFPTSLVLGKRTQSAGATPELARSQGVRFGCLQEPDSKDIMNVGTIKELTGNDSFYARALFKEGKDIKPMFKLALICNKPPQLSSDCDASWNRILLLPFEARFAKKAGDVPRTLEEQLKAKIFPRDPLFSEKLPKMKQAFMWILVQTFKSMIKSGPMECPEKVTEATDLYRRNNDIFLQYVTECIKEEEKSALSLTEIYNSFTQWFRESFPNVKVPIKNELKDDLLRRWGPPGEGMKWTGLKVRTVRDDIAEGRAVVIGKADLEIKVPKTPVGSTPPKSPLITTTPSSQPEDVSMSPISSVPEIDEEKSESPKSMRSHSSASARSDSRLREEEDSDEENSEDERSPRVRLLPKRR